MTKKVVQLGVGGLVKHNIATMPLFVESLVEYKARCLWFIIRS